MPTFKSNIPWMPLLLLSAQMVLFAITAGIFIILARAFFLEYHEADTTLPLVYVTIAVVGSSFFYVMRLLVDRLPLSTIVIATVLILTVLIGGLWLTLSNDIATAASSFAMMVLFPIILQSMYVTVGVQARTVFDIQQTKRLLPIIFSGVSVGMGLAGVITLPLQEAVKGREENLLLLCVVLLLVTFVVQLRTIRVLPKTEPRLVQTVKQPTTHTTRARNNRYVNLIFIYQMLSALGTELMVFIFLIQMQIQYPQQAQVVEFMGYYSVGLNLVIFLFTFIVAGRLMASFGLRLGLTLNPAVALVMLGLLFASLQVPSLSSLALGTLGLVFVFATLPTSLDIILSQSTTATSVNALYQSLPATQSNAVQTRIEGIGVPVAQGLTGLVLLVFAAVFPDDSAALTSIVAFAMVVTVAWLTVGLVVYSQYVQALKTTILRRSFDNEKMQLVDSTSLQVIESFLNASELSTVQLGLDLLESNEYRVISPYLERLLKHPDAVIRQEAMQRVERLKLLELQPAIKYNLLNETTVDNLAAAIRTFCAVGDDLVEIISPYLRSDQPQIQSAAITGLLHHGSLAGIVAAGQYLLEMIAAPDPSKRAVAAHILGEIGDDSFYAPLQPLLTDIDLSVRRAAIQAAGEVGHIRLMPALISALGQRVTRSTAIRALAKYDLHLTQWLDIALNDPQTPYVDEVINGVIEAAKKSKNPGLVPLLSQHISHQKLEVREHILYTLFACRYEATPAMRAAVERVLLEEARFSLENLNAQQALKDKEELRPLYDAMVDEFHQSRKRLFLLLSFLYDGKFIMDAEHLAASSMGKERALALETLEVILKGHHETLALGVVKQDPQLLATIVNNVPPIHLESPETLTIYLHQLLKSSQENWIKACVLYVVGKVNLKTMLPYAEAMLQSPDVIVRETAVWTVYHLDSHCFEVHAEELQHDPDPRIAMMVQKFSTKQRGTVMLTTIERVALLRSIELFADTASSILAYIAGIAEEHEVSAGELIFNQGDMDLRLYIIVSGEVKVHKNDVTVAVLKAGESVGEMQVFDPAPRSASVTALTDCHLLSIDKLALDEILVEEPDIAMNVIKILARRLRVTTAHSEETNPA